MTASCTMTALSRLRKEDVLHITNTAALLVHKCWEWLHWGRLFVCPAICPNLPHTDFFCVICNQQWTYRAIWSKRGSLDLQRWSHTSLNFAQTQVTILFPCFCWNATDQTDSDDPKTERKNLFGQEGCNWLR